MRWEVTLTGSRRTVEFLTSQPLYDRLSAVPDEPTKLLMTLDGFDEGEGDPDQAKAAVDQFVENVNSTGKLRWGREFGGLDVEKFVGEDSTGKRHTRMFIEPAHDHMQPSSQRSC